MLRLIKSVDEFYKDLTNKIELIDMFPVFYNLIQRMFGSDKNIFTPYLPPFKLPNLWFYYSREYSIYEVRFKG